MPQIFIRLPERAPHKRELKIQDVKNFRNSLERQRTGQGNNNNNNNNNWSWIARETALRANIANATGVNHNSLRAYANKYSRLEKAHKLKHGSLSARRNRAVQLASTRLKGRVGASAMRGQLRSASVRMGNNRVHIPNHIINAIARISLAPTPYRRSAPRR